MFIRPTILNVPALLYLSGCVAYTIINYPTLSHAEGWGVVFMVGLFVYGLTALVADLVIHNVLTTAKAKFLARLIVLLLYCLVFFMGM